MFNSVKRKIILSFFVATFLLSPGTLATAQGECSLGGRVIDENKKPVSNARIYLDPLKKDEDNPVFYVGAESDASGEFTIEFSDCSTVHTRELFAIAATDWNAVAEFFVPDELSFFLPVNGQKIQVIKNGHTKVGDIQQHVLLKTFEVKLLDEKGENFFKSKDDWGKLIYQLYGRTRKPIVQLRAIRQNLVSEGGISWKDVEKAVSEDGSGIKINLPDGKWRLVLFPKGCKGTFQATSDYFELAKGNQPKIQIVAKKTKAGNKCLLP